MGDLLWTTVSGFMSCLFTPPGGLLRLTPPSPVKDGREDGEEGGASRSRGSSLGPKISCVDQGV